jgi:hypothetical protein
MLVSSYESELSNNEVNSADFTRIEKAVSDFGLSTEEFLPVMINNSELSTSQALSGHFNNLIFLTAGHIQAFPIAQQKNLVGSFNSMSSELKNGINSVISAWKTIADAFKTTTKSTIKSTIETKGWSLFKSDSRFSKTTDIAPEFYPRLKTITLSRMQIPEKY